MPEETATEGSTSAPWDRLLGDAGATPTVIVTNGGNASQNNGTDKQNNKQETGFLSSFQRSFKMSVGGKDPQHVFSR